MGRAYTDRKVHMEPQGDFATSSVSSSPSSYFISRTLTAYDHTNGSSNDTISSAATTSTTTEKSTEGGSSTIRSSLKKLSTFGSNRKKALTKLGSQYDYEQIEEEEEQPPPTADCSAHSAAPAGRIFSSRHRSSTFGGTAGASSSILHRGGDEVVVRIDDSSTPRAGPSSNGASLNVVRSGGPALARGSSQPAAELVISEPPSSPHEPVLEELDSFDEGNDDEHFRIHSTVSSDSGASATPTGAGAVPGAGAGVGAGTATNWHPGLPPRPPTVDVTNLSRIESDGGGGSQDAYGVGIQSQGSYDFRKDVPLPQGSSSRIESVGTSGEPSNPNPSNLARRKSTSFDLGTVVEDDPPTKLIARFLRGQSESGSDCLDLDLDMEELNPLPKLRKHGHLSTIPSGDFPEDLTPTPSPSPERVSAVKDSSYGDLVQLDLSETSSAPSFLRAGAPGAPGAPTSPNQEEFQRWKVQSLKDQSMNYHSNSLSLPPDLKPPDVKINVGADKRYATSREEAVSMAAPTRSPSPENDIAGGLESPSSAGVRWRKNSSFRPTSSPPTPRGPGEREVLKSPAQYAVRPTYSRLRSRLADLPKPPEITKVSGVIDESKMKSGQARNSKDFKSEVLGNKLKKVEEEEEDPLKVTDLPDKYRKTERGIWRLLQLSALLIILAGLVCILSVPTLRRMNRGGLLLWKWALLVLVVFCGRLISGWIVWVLVFIIEKNFLLRKKVVYFVYALRKGVQTCLWLGFALLAWHFIIGPNVNGNYKVVRYITKVLVCFLVAAFIVLLKTVIVKVFASSFHVNNYFERIQEALFNQYIMETLAGPPMIEYEQDTEEEKKLNEEIAGLREAGATGPSLSKVGNLPRVASSGLPPRPSVNTRSAMLGTQSGVIGRSPQADEKTKKQTGSHAELNLGISVDTLQKLDISNISAWNMKRLIHIIRNSTLTHSLEETVNTGEGAETEIQSEWQAKSAAKAIFNNVAKPGRSVITEDDLLRFMREEETKKALGHFDGAVETKRVTKKSLKKWVVDVYKERRALAYSLNDTKTAVNKLHRMIDVVVGVIVIVIWLLLLGIATTKLLLFLSSQVLLLILVWGNTLKTTFEAIVFLFIMHPFDVGDRCVVDGMQLVVEEMNILTTVFLGDFNVKVWFPNSVLATKPIQNFYRSPEMGDAIDFIVQSSTPVDKVAAFKERIGKYIESKPNHWCPDFGLNVMQMGEGERMKLSLGLKHTINYQDMGEIVKRRSELLMEMKLHLEGLGIEYHVPAQEVHITQRKEF